MRGAIIVSLLLAFTAVSPSEAALREATPNERESLRGTQGVTLPSGTLFSSTDSQIISCPDAKPFLKSKSSNPSSIDGLKPSFACSLQSLLKAVPGITIGVGTYKTKSAANCNDQRQQCRTGANINGGTHEKGCAADLLYNGQKGPGGNAGPPWCRGNPLCRRAHDQAASHGLQFRLMPGHPGATSYYEVWHVETKGARAGFCPDGPGGNSSTPMSQGGTPQSGGGAPSGNEEPFNPERLEHELMERDPNIVKPEGTNAFADQENLLFDEPDGDGVLAQATEPTPLSQRFSSLLSPESADAETQQGEETKPSILQTASRAVGDWFRGIFNPEPAAPVQTATPTSPQGVQYASVEPVKKTYGAFCRWIGGCAI